MSKDFSNSGFQRPLQLLHWEQVPPSAVQKTREKLPPWLLKTQTQGQHAKWQILWTKNVNSWGPLGFTFIKGFLNLGSVNQRTGNQHKRRVWLFVWNIKKCMKEYWRVLYRKLISRNGQVKAQNKCKPTSVVVCCRFCGSTWRIWAILWVLRWLLLYVIRRRQGWKAHFRPLQRQADFHPKIRIARLPNQTPDKLKGWRFF